jgi:Flp pilus assembly pilin Flp
VGILIAVVIIGGVTMVGTELNNIYEYISHCVEDWSCD